MCTILEFDLIELGEYLKYGDAPKERLSRYQQYQALITNGNSKN